MSESDANAYKTTAEGKAVLVTAWMPLLQLVTVLMFAFLILLAVKLGILDSQHLQLITDLLSLIKQP